MSRPIRLSELADFITCPVCHGYLIDATTVNECLHTFCKSCIVKHIKNNNNECPKCNTVIHERRPLDYILYDRNKQDIVYKLVPQLYISEMLRKMAVQDVQDLDPLTKRVLRKKHIYVALVQQPRKRTTFITLDPAPSASQTATQQQSPSHSSTDTKLNESSHNPIYLKCPMDIRVRQLRKLLAVKYQLDAQDRLYLLYKGDIVSDNDQVSNLAQSISFILHYKISRLYPAPDETSTTSSSTLSNDSDKMSVDEIK